MDERWMSGSDAWRHDYEARIEVPALDAVAVCCLPISSRMLRAQLRVRYAYDLAPHVKRRGDERRVAPFSQLVGRCLVSPSYMSGLAVHSCGRIPMEKMEKRLADATDQRARVSSPMLSAQGILWAWRWEKVVAARMLACA